ncbi:hypothetical protein NDU88_005182 [Pleurodeles waltl]|uniref:Gag protein n=1 Tax=Pleurodeles waltl TaxID=8319 RepID=A0AAV7TUW5_PLEWA|nr:hypothetical protein NDU88_005182 [Pleurodeles waltl]
MLLHLGCTAIHKINISVVKEGPPFSYQSLKRALTTHFESLANPDYERFLLRQARQLPEESVDTFYARLNDLASTYTLPNTEDKERAQFSQVCHSTKLREHILQVPGMAMADMLTMGWSKELSRVHAAHMESALQKPMKTEPVNVISAGMPAKKKARPKPLGHSCTCYMCGGAYPHQGKCPAQGKQCTNCKKRNHFAKVCRCMPVPKSTMTKTVHAAHAPPH